MKHQHYMQQLRFRYIRPHTQFSWSATASHKYVSIAAEPLGEEILSPEVAEQSIAADSD